MKMLGSINAEWGAGAHHMLMVSMYTDESILSQGNGAGPGSYEFCISELLTVETGMLTSFFKALNRPGTEE